MGSNMKQDLPESEVIVKLSMCDQGHFVCAAIKHLMDRKSTNDFAKEVVKYNLSVKEMPLLEYRASGLQYCTCKK